MHWRTYSIVNREPRLREAPGKSHKVTVNHCGMFLPHVCCMQLLETVKKKVPAVPWDPSPLLVLPAPRRRDTVKAH